MRRLLGPRTVAEAAFLVAVPIIALAVGLSAWGIVAASAVAYLLVFVVEAVIWQSSRAPRRLEPARRARAATIAPSGWRGPDVHEEPLSELGAVTVSVRRADREPEEVGTVRVVGPSPAEPEPSAAPEPPAPVEAAPQPEPTPVPVRMPEREPVATPRPPLVAAPPPAPEPVAEAAPAPPEPTPEPEVVTGGAVVPIGAAATPRRWNLWDLERLTREGAGVDVVVDEERTFLLMYLREFADASGALPVDFDGLVRDSFGDLVER